MTKKGFASRPFEKLKKRIERTQLQPAGPPPQKKKKEEYTDEELFTNEMKGVQEIADFRARAVPNRVVKPAARLVPVSPDRDAIAELEAIASGQAAMHLPDTQEYVEWYNPDHQESILPRLHEGQFAVQEYVDLHGFTVPEAEEELELFLRAAFLKNVSCIKIIHGRGLRSVKGPLIKDAVIRRLLGKHRHQIIAFVSARQCDGGLGALYVLLRAK